MKRRCTLVAIVSLLAIVALTGCSVHRGIVTQPTGDCPTADALIAHPAYQLAKNYQELDFTCILVVPYFLHVMANYSLLHDRHATEVKNYLDWVFAHLNETDRWGLSGTLFDYVLCCDGTEISTLQYDSADGYAGQLLILMEAYYRKTGDARYLNRHQRDLLRVANVIVALQDDDDGLSIAMIGYPVKYTMDNSESYAGLASYCRLAKELGWPGYDDIAGARDAMKAGLLNHLYDSKRRIFHWAIDAEKQLPSQWDKFYPDALSQIFPLLYGLVEAESTLGRHLWKEFASRYREADMEGVEQKLLYRMTRAMMDQAGACSPAGGKGCDA